MPRNREGGTLILSHSPRLPSSSGLLSFCSPCQIARQSTDNSAHNLALILQKSLANIRVNILVLPSMVMGWANRWKKFVCNQERNPEWIVGEFLSTGLGKKLWECAQQGNSQSFWRGPILLSTILTSTYCLGLFKLFLDAEFSKSAIFFYMSIIFKMNPQYEQECCLFRTSTSCHYFEGFAYSTKSTHFSGWKVFLEMGGSYSVFSQKGFILQENNLLIPNSEGLSP